MKKTVVFINGDINNYQWHKQLIANDDTIICADGGTYHALKMDLIPDMIIGDFDSLCITVVEALQKKGTAIERLNCDKNEMDSEIALIKALEQQPEQLIILGGLGTRIDYNLSNIHLLVPVLHKGLQARLINEEIMIFLVNQKFPGYIQAKPGTRVSILPLTSEIKAITLSGFKYPLNDDTIPIGQSWGMSNVLLAETGTITLQEGIAVVFQELNHQQPLF